MPDVFSPAEVAEMRAEFDRLRQIEGEFGGHEVHIEPGAPRLSNLFNKSPAYDRCLSASRRWPRPSICSARSASIRSTPAARLKGEGQQLLHSDVPRVTPNDWRVVNSMVMLDDMTPDNGPTRVVPGLAQMGADQRARREHGRGEKIEVTPEDRADHARWTRWPPHPKEIKLTGKAGSVAVINGSIWHGGTRNDSGAPRRVLHLAIGRRDLPQQLNEREHLTPELLSAPTRRRVPPRHRRRRRRR